MQLKTYSGVSNRDVMDQIKAELGSEAVILETKVTRVNGQKMVSMTAALDRLETFDAPESPAQGAPDPFGGARADHMGAAPGGGGYGNSFMASEWGQIKRHLLALMKPALNLEILDQRQRSAMEFLERDGAGDQALLELYRRLASRPGMSVLEPLAGLMTMKPWGLEDWPQRVHMLAGPFGAGKTTAAVRMALWLKKKRPGLRICMVNADAERGNGRLLLRHYAGISDLIYREAGNAVEMAGVLGEITSQGFDKIIVDLPGLQQGRHLAEVVTELGLTRLESFQTALHVVLSPHYDQEALSSILSRYRLDLPMSLVWSKLDEGGRFGSMLNASVSTGLPISTFSFGPGLLNTLAPARQITLWKLLFKHELPSAQAAAQPGE